MEKRGYSNTVVKSISGIMICTIVCKLLGFIRELVLSYFFGTSGISDAYLVSQAIPSTIFEFVGAGISTCFIPIYFKILNIKNKKEADKFTNKLTTLILTFSTLIIAIVLGFAPLIVKIFASGFFGETLSLAVSFTRICILSLYFSTFVFIYGAYLQANNRFIQNSFSAVILSIVILCSIILGAKINIWLMSIGSCLAVGTRLFFIIPAAHEVGLKTRLNFHWKDEYVKEFFVLMIPVIFGASINEINTLIDRTVASQIAVGGISSLVYANSLLQLAAGGIVQPFSTVVYPQITDAIHQGKVDEAKELLLRMINILMLLLVPITFGIYGYSQPVVSLLFARGAFDEMAIKMTSEAFTFYGIGLCFIGIREMLSRFYYACEDTKTPVINSSIGLIINIILNIYISRYIGLKGLALATSISAIVTTVLLWMRIKKFSKVNGFHMDVIELLKMIICAVLMIVTSLILFNYLFKASRIGLIVSIIFAVFIYFFTANVLKVKAVFEAKNIVIKTIKRKKVER